MNMTSCIDVDYCTQEVLITVIQKNPEEFWPAWKVFIII